MRRSDSAAVGDGARQAAPLVVGLALYELARLLISTDWSRAVGNARRVQELERSLHVAWERPLQHAFLGLPDLVRALNVLYLGHFLFTALFFLWLYRRSRSGFARFRDGFLAAVALAALVHWLFPAAPPRLAGVGVGDTLRQLSGIDIGSPGSVSATNPVAALPSLHAGFALGVGIGLIRYGGWRAKLLGVSYPLAVVLTIVVTGNHFLLDAVAGGAVMMLGLLVSFVAQRASRPLRPWKPPRTRLYCDPRRGVEQSGSSPGS
jgi:membrane-associated phospholipid phosphatase